MNYRHRKVVGIVYGKESAIRDPIQDKTQVSASFLFATYLVESVHNNHVMSIKIPHQCIR